MNLYTITVVHCEPETLAHGIRKLSEELDSIPPATTILVDNRWPLSSTKNSIELAAGYLGAQVVTCFKNLGGAGGVNAALPLLNGAHPSDLVLIFDPDSNPVSPRWLQAMMAVMNADPTLAYISLLHNGCAERPWAKETIGGHQVGFLPQTDMISVCLFRYSFIQNGMPQELPFYGAIERPLSARAKIMGLRHGWMLEYREDSCPIPHPQVYNDWKRDHALQKFPGNFDEYIAERNKR